MFIFVSGFNFNLHIDWVIYNLRYIKFTGSVEITDRHRLRRTVKHMVCRMRWLRVLWAKKKHTQTHSRGMVGIYRGCALSAMPPGECITENQHSYVFLTIVLIKMSTRKKNNMTISHHTHCEHRTFRSVSWSLFAVAATTIAGIKSRRALCAIQAHHIGNFPFWMREKKQHTSAALWWTANDRGSIVPWLVKCIESPGWFSMCSVCKYAACVEWVALLTMMLMLMEG